MPEDDERTIELMDIYYEVFNMTVGLNVEMFTDEKEAIEYAKQLAKATKHSVCIDRVTRETIHIIE